MNIPKAAPAFGMFAVQITCNFVIFGTITQDIVVSSGTME